VIRITVVLQDRVDPHRVLRAVLELTPSVAVAITRAFTYYLVFIK